MSTFWARRADNALVPDGTDSIAVFERLSRTQPIRVEAKTPRNAGHHRLYWSLCARIGTAIGQPSEVIDHILKISTGHCETVKTKKYGWIRIPKSISFSNLKQEDFDIFFEACVRTIYSEFGIARPEILQAVSDLLEPKSAAHVKPTSAQAEG